MGDSEKKEKDQQPRPKYVVRTPTDIQRIKLKKLMDNPEKVIAIPSSSALQKNNEYSSTAAPLFVRNVMGSSAGAGSGEFHVYRHLRRKEYARQKQIQQKSLQEQLDDDFRHKLEQNQLLAESKTAKKRAKRMKRKKNAKNKKLTANKTNTEQLDSSSNTDSEQADEETSKQNPTSDSEQCDTEHVKE